MTPYFNDPLFKKMSKNLPKEHPINNLLKKIIENVELGKSLFKQGKYCGAEKSFLEAVKLDAKSEQAYFGLGQIYYIQNKLPEAEKAFKKAISVNNDNKYAYIELGKALLEQGKYDESEKSFLKAVKLDPRSEEVHYELGKVYWTRDRLPDAGKELKKAARINEKNKNTALLLAKVYKKGNKYVPALQIFLKLISPGDDNKAIYAEIESLYTNTGKYDLAINGYKEAIKRGIDDLWVYAALAKAYVLKGEYDSAIKEYKKAIEKGADGENMHLEIAQAYYKNGQYDIAREKFNRIKNMPPSIDVLYMLLDISRKLKKESGFEYIKKEEISISKEEYDNAVKECKEAVKGGDEGVDVRLKIAGAYYRNKQYGLAIEEYAKAQKLSPSLETLRLMAQIYKKLKKFDLCINTGYEYIKRENEEDSSYNKKLIKTFSARRKNGDVEKELTVKIIRTPYFEGKQKDGFEKKQEYEINYCMLLPLGIARIVSYLKSNGIKVDQDDLYIKVNHSNMFASVQEKIDGEVFFDEKRIKDYAQGKDDQYIEEMLEKVEKKTKLEGYKVILVSLPEIIGNTSGYMFLLSFARYLKKKYNPVIIAGGTMVNDFINYDLKDIDFIIKGKGEKPLFILLTALKYKIDIAEIPGISIGNNGKLITTSLHSKLDVIPDFTGLPMPLYKYRNKRKLDDEGDKEIKDINNEFNKSKILVSPFMFMEGCSHECAFCTDSASNILLSLDPARSVEYLGKLNKKYGIKYFLFLNNTINLSKKYINEFCDEIISSELKILWSDCARADNLDRETLVKMRKAGCIRLVYGMETASPKLLKYIDKEINLKRLKNILSWTDEAGIWTGIEIISGFPHETKEDLDMTVDFLRKNKSYINNIYYNIFYLIRKSRFDLFHERYGIENIFDLDTYQYTRRELKGLNRVGFDEAGGFKWKDKIRQMTAGYDYVVNKTYKYNSYLQAYEMEHFLFYLYSKFKKKNEIVRIFNKVSKAYHCCPM